MAQRSLNKVELIGNLTRDPELRYTPQGTAVCSFGLATNRSWTTDNGEKKESVEFHRIVAWNKLAELCSQLLTKGRKVFVEGRLQTRQWTGQDGASRQTTEIVINEMIILDSRRAPGETGEDDSASLSKIEDKSLPAAEPELPAETSTLPKEETVPSTAEPTAKTEKADDSQKKGDNSAKKKVEPEDIPF